MWTHVRVPETKELDWGADRRPMQTQELKRRVETGAYKPDPSLIAAAMLERRGIRELLSFSSSPISSVGRNPQSAPARHRAA